MQYRYGIPTSLELTFPRTEVPLPSGFKYFESHFAKGGTLALSFRIGSYRYSVFHTSSAYGFNGSGLFVDQGSKHRSYQACRLETVAFHPDLFMKLPKYGVPAAGDDVAFIAADDCATQECLKTLSR
jgi:hypothetical protein